VGLDFPNAEDFEFCLVGLEAAGKGGTGCCGPIWGLGTITGAIDDDCGDPILGVLVKYDGSGGMYISSSTGAEGWYT
jgi:hypothetical protein